MNKYELVIIVDAQITQQEKEEIYQQATDIVIKGGGKVINGQVWIEKQKFSFCIKKKWEGTYYLINFEGAGSIVSEIRKLLRLNERILRSAITKGE